MRKLIASVLCCGLMLAVQVQAEIHKCKSNDGSVHYTDKPCPPQTTLESSMMTPEEKREAEWQQAREKRAELERQQAKVTAQTKVAENKERTRILNSWKPYTGKEYGLVNDEKGNTIPAVESALRRVLKDPDSLVMEDCEPVLTNGLRYRARCQYRAKNGFGGYDRFVSVFYFNTRGEYVTNTESAGKPLALEGTSF